MLKFNFINQIIQNNLVNKINQVKLVHHRTALRYFSFHFPNVFKQVSGAVKSERWQKIVFPSRLNPHTGGSSAIWEKAGGGLGGKKAEKEGFGGAGGAGGGEQVLDA